ncbi:MAG: transketolase family protein [Firmicutes bacterium]|nr:transketolase family protein [Bacillota bacterium]
MADMIATRDSFSKVLVQLGEEDPNIIAMNADLSASTKTDAFEKRFPERFINAGIAECNMLGMAAGLALSGKTVFASSFCMFASGRAFEIIRNSIAHTNANVKLCASHAGLAVGEDGATHQSVEDLAIMRDIPGMKVLSPADDVSARKLIRAAAKEHGPFYIRLGRAAAPVVYPEDAEFEIGKAVTVREGSDYTLLSTGCMLETAMKAADELAAEGISVRILDMHSIKPIDEDAIVKAALETKGLVTVEDHSIIGGLGSAVAEVLCEKAPAKLRRVGIKDCFGESGKPAQLYEKYGLTVKDVVAAVKSL